MAQHYKTFWRKQIIAVITGNTLAGTAVYTNMVTPNAIDNLWVNVSTADETIGNEPHESSLSGSLFREQRYMIDVCCRDNTLPMDTIEEVGGQIEQLLLSDEFISDSAFGTDYEGCTVKVADNLEKTTIIYSMIFNVRGVTPRTNPFM